MKKKANGSSTAGPAANKKKVVADFKRKFQSETLREKLVNNIIYYAGNDYESRQDYLELARESDEQLVDRLIHILDYYHDCYNNPD